MKTCHQALLVLTLSFGFVAARAQDNAENPRTLVQQGIALNDSGKFDAAIAKYQRAIKIDPQFENAYYEIGYSLFSSGKEADAIPYLEKLIAMDPKSAGAMDLIGSIYDDLKQPDKAEVYYKQGIDADPNYQRLHFNLAILYYRQKRYADAEARAIEAIKLDPKHASSHRIYAMATYRQGKRGISLLAWSNFLLLEPQSKRSAEGVAYLKDILNTGISRKDDKHVTLTVSPDDAAAMMLPMAVVTATDGKTNLTPVDSLELQLKSVYQIASTIADSKANPLIANFYADYFSALAKTENMPAFAHFITLSVFREDDLQWFKANDGALKKLDAWVTATGRKF